MVVAVDFSDPSQVALDYAVANARSLKCTILMVYVIERIYGEGYLDRNQAEKLRDESRRTAEAKLNAWAASKRVPSVSIRSEIRSGLPSVELLKAAKVVNTKMIVIGRAPTTRFARFILGSVTQNILDVSPFPVLVIPSPKTPRRKRSA